MPFDEGNPSINGEFAVPGSFGEIEEGLDGTDEPDEEDDA